ncbi:acetolactate decarboxylase [Humidesulfovibrio mexicanus]|uniref:Alpha-acetolactate decarboxylase n=1 Tax=Humidesulfovibrio mexicanus TaxID=147047 RepID=A0A239CS18_9BACT|nr:acetolactate decarboxylase [Humidesulfovibrio mexicanus]SNS22729.1 acetolactate decarboxylase [Humidesulfovibrio mexicanus]
MQRIMQFVFSTILSLACLASAMAADTPALTQVGVIDALLAGGYEGAMSIERVRALGDIGLGTFDALDGEMVVLDGRVHQVLASGAVVIPPDSLTTPFAQVARMGAQAAFPLEPGLDLEGLGRRLDAVLGDANVFAAARVDGRFASLSARSVPRQSPPYRPLAEVAKEQTLFRFQAVEGTLVGLRGPAYAKGLGVPGWHWHFLTRDRTRGGHVLSCVLDATARPQARVSALRRFVLVLPDKGLSGFDLGRDRSGELHSVEAPQ